jgi:hypothetical protein
LPTVNYQTLAMCLVCCSRLVHFPVDNLARAHLAQQELWPNTLNDAQDGTWEDLGCYSAKGTYEL